MIKRLRLAALLALLCLATALGAEPYPAGSSQRSVNIDGETIELFAYKPSQYKGGPVLLVLHGVGTNAPGYRNYAIPIADQLGMLVIAPLFDRKRFPTWRYQTGGLVRDQRADGEFTVVPSAQWAGQLVLPIIHAVRAAGGRPDLGGDAILAAIQRGLAIPSSEWPGVAPSKRPEPESAGLVDLLQAVLQARANEEHMTPTLLATSSDLQALLEAKHDREKVELPILSGWRRKLAGELLLQVLAGKVSVSIDHKSGKLKVSYHS